MRDENRPEEWDAALERLRAEMRQGFRQLRIMLLGVVGLLWLVMMVIWQCTSTLPR
jgi:hypothetical protein